MKGQLNMSQPMEDLIKAISINQWPGRNPFSQCRWESKAWPSMKSLISEFKDMLERIIQLQTWSANLVTPFSVWLPGLFNPTSYLTAVMQVTARRTGMPLDQMTTETHITTFLKPDTIDYYPTDGAFIHGLYIEGKLGFSRFNGFLVSTLVVTFDFHSCLTTLRATFDAKCLFSTYFMNYHRCSLAYGRRSR
jgi:dynein heavy chain